MGRIRKYINKSDLENLLEKRREIKEESFEGSEILEKLEGTKILYGDSKEMSADYIYLHALDRLILNIFAHSLRHSFVDKKEWMLLYPADKFKLFPLLGLESFGITNEINTGHAFTAEKIVEGKKKFDYRNSVMVISDKTEIRTLYRNLYTKGTGRHKKSLNHRYLRLGVVGMDGTIETLKIDQRKSDDVDKVYDHFWHANSLENLPKKRVKQLSAVIVDLNGIEEISSLKKFREWALEKYDIPLVMYVSTNILSGSVEYLLEKDVDVWGMRGNVLSNQLKTSIKSDKRYVEGDEEKSESDGLKSPSELAKERGFVITEKNQTRNFNLRKEIKDGESPFLSTFPSLLNNMGDINNKIVNVDSKIINNYLTNIKKDTFEIKKSLSEYSEASATVRQLTNTRYAIEELTAPLEISEKHLKNTHRCKPISERIIDIEKLIQGVRREDNTLAEYLNSILGSVKELRDYMMNEREGKPIWVEKILREAKKHDKSICFITRIKASREALEEYLEKIRNFDIEELEKNDIHIKTYKQWERNPYYDRIVFFGRPRRQHLKIFESSNSPCKIFLLYNSEKRLFEWLFENREPPESIFDYRSRIQNLSKITGIGKSEIKKHIQKTDPEINNDKVSINEFNPIQDDAEKKSYERFEHKNFNQYESLEEFINYEAKLELEEKNISQMSQATDKHGLVNCIKLALDGEKEIYLPKHKKVSVYDMVREDVSHHKKAKNVKKGDVIVLVESLSFKSLIDAVISKLERRPEMMKTITYHQMWIEVLKDGMKKSDHTRSNVSNLLSKKGINRTPQAVYNWVNGKVVGPKQGEERKVIRSIGEIYDSKRISENLDDIVNSVRRLRKIKRKIKQKLRHFATHHAGEISSDEDEIVDEDLDIYLSDFKDVITLERVKKVIGEEKVNTFKTNRIL